MGVEQSTTPRVPTLPPDWRYTIRTMTMENRTLNINKEPYLFRKELGSGAFGCVFAARRTTDGKPVAIKVASLVSMSSGQAEMLAASILNEIEMSKRLSQASKHVVRMFDFDFHRHSGLAFLVMELGEKDLEKALTERGRLSPTERKFIWKQLVDIAVILDRENIVHLDIKPQNLVVFSGNRVKLVDLGIAQKAYQLSVGSNGTWLYSAPEVTTATRHRVAQHTSKADVWSWGAVLYRMTYLKAPEYDPPCHHPPHPQSPSRDPQLVDVLRHTLISDPHGRASVGWMARHPYSTS